MKNKHAYFILTVFYLLILSCGGGGGDSVLNTPPAAPEKVISAGGNAEVYLSWENASGATTYNIYWSTTADVRRQSGTKISAATSPYYHKGLNNDTIYYYVVTAANQYGESAESLEVSATPSQFTPSLPPREVVAFGFNRKVIIRWSAVEAEDVNTSYNIYWSTSKDVTKGSGTKIADPASPYTHDNLINGTTYYYVVTGVNQYGESLESQESSATPAQGDLPSAPTGVTAVAGDRQALISWNVVDNAVAYNIYWSSSPDISSKNGIKLADVKSPYNHTGLIQGKTYYYVITAANGYGESDDSDRVSAMIPNKINDICVALGDSITRGDMATNYTNSYVSLLSTRLGKIIINEGVGGAYSSYGAAMIDYFLSAHNPKYITIYFGTTDAGVMDPDDTMSNLQYIIERAKNNGTIPGVATLGPFFDTWAWKNTYAIHLNQKIRELAASQGVACADLQSAMDWNKNYISSDGLHPNDEGHRVISETFYKALTQ